MPLSVLVINPGSTSSKLALFDEKGVRFEDEVEHPGSLSALPIAEQLPARRSAILDFLARHGDPHPDAVCGRGGPLRPLEGGTYRVDEAMLADLRSARHGEHASLLGGLLAQSLAAAWRVPAFVVDPVTVDELEPRARISGVPGIVRSGRSHALNLKAVARLAAADADKPLARTRFVAAHMGGGISVAALAGGRIVDVNDALLGMGPFSPYRAGALPLRGLLDLAFAPGAQRQDLEKRLSNLSGLMGYLGTGDLREVERRIASGDREAESCFLAMRYQIAKEIGAMSAALAGELDGVILTGGMSRSALLVAGLEEDVAWMGRIFVYPGEREMTALAEGAFRVLRGEEEAMRYGDGASESTAAGAPARDPRGGEQ